MKKVLFLGGAFSQIPIIEEAKRQGLYVITCDYSPENPGHKLADEYYNLSTTDFEKVLSLARFIKPDFIIAYASDPAAPVAAYVSECLGLPGNNYKCVEILSRKDLFRELLFENGFNVPKAKSFFLEDFSLGKISDLKLPLVVKPVDGSGSKGISKVISLKDIKKSIDYALKFSRIKKVIIEEYIENYGNQLHGDGFVLNGKLSFIYLGDHHYSKINSFVPYSTTWPSYRSNELLEKVNREIERLLNLVEYMNGPLNIEVRINEGNEVYIMEIGPRSGGNFVPQVIQYSTGFNIVKTILGIYTNKTIIINRFIPKPAAYYVLQSEKEGLLKEIKISDDLKNNIIKFYQYTKKGQQVQSFQNASSALGVLTLKFKNSEEMNYKITNMEKFLKIKVS